MKNRYHSLMLHALKINPAHYEAILINHALRWIASQFGHDYKTQEVVASSPLFWLWWRNQWSLRDDKFVYETSLHKLQYPITSTDKELLMELYLDTHSVADLNIQFNKLVRDELSKLFKKEMKREYQNIKNLKNEA